MGFFDSLFGKSKGDAVLSDIINKGAFLVDVRTAGEFAQGSVKGSVNIPLDQILNLLPRFQNKENIVVFCRSGNRSSHAKAILEQRGFTNVFNGGTWHKVESLLNK